MDISDWLSRNPGPYEVCLLTFFPGEDASEYTAGRVSMRADSADVRDGVVAFCQGEPQSPAGEIVLVRGAFVDPQATDNGWAAGYANLQVSVDGFYPDVVVTVRKADDSDA